MDKNVIRKSLSVFLLVCVFFSAFAVTASAATVLTDYTVTQTSFLEQDLKHMYFEGELFDEADYPYSKNDTCFYIMRFLEVGFNGTGFGENAGIYLFIYNPSQMEFDCESDQNRISFSMYGSGGKVNGVTKYDLIFCDSYMDMRFVKYRVNIEVSTLREYLTYASRNYHVTDLELKSTDGNNAVAYDVSATYTYTGSGKELYCNTYALYTISVDLASTYYRPDVVSESGMNYRNELHTAYFAIPNGFIRKYGDLYSVQGEYYEQRIASVITENEAYFNMMQPLEGSAVSDLSGYDSDLKGSLSYPALNNGYVTSTSEGGGIVEYSFYDVNLAQKTTVLVPLYRTGAIPYIPYIYHVGDIVADEIAVSSEEITNRVASYGGEVFTTTGEQNTEKTLYDISIEDGYNLNSYASTHTGFETLIAGLRSWFSQDISTNVAIKSALVKVYGNDFRYGNSDFSEKYYVAESDVEAIREAYNTAINSDKSLYLLRFDTSEVLTVEMEIDAQESGIEVDDAQETYYYEQNYYKDFDTLSFTFKSVNGSLTTIGAVSSPIDIVGDIVPTDDIKFTLGWELPDPDSWWKVLVAIVLILLLAIIVLQVLMPTLQTAVPALSKKLSKWWRNFKRQCKSLFRPHRRKKQRTNKNKNRKE